MLSSDNSSSLLADELCSESPERCIEYIQKENDHISEQNENLAKQVRVLKDQFERAVDSSSGLEDIIQENKQLRAEIGKLQLERQDFAQRLKISLNSNQQITEEYKKKVAEIENSITPMKQQYEAQISKLNLQIIHFKELHEQTETDLAVMKTQANALLSLATDVYEQPFFTLPALAEYINQRESSVKKKLIEVETNAQNKVEKAENKAQKWKNRFIAQKEAAESNIQTLELELANEKDQHNSTLKQLNDIRNQTPVLAEKSVQSVIEEPQNEVIMQTPNISMASEIMSPVKIDPKKTEADLQEQANTDMVQMKSKLDQSLQQLSEAEMKYHTVQQNLVQAEDRVAQMAAELNKYKSMNQTMEQTINQLKDSNQTMLQNSIAKDESMREETRKTLELAKEENEKSLRELELSRKDTEAVKQQLSVMQQERDNYKKRADELRIESEKNESNFKSSQAELETMKNNLHQVTKDIKKSQEEFGKQAKTMKSLQTKIHEKTKQNQELEATVKQLKAKIQKMEKKKPTVTFVKPINWQELKLTAEVMNELEPHLQEKMTEKEQLETAVKVVSNHYLQKINKLVIDSQEKTKTMVSQIQTLISFTGSSPESKTYTEMITMLKRRLEQTKKMEQEVKEVCDTCDVANISDLSTNFQSILEQRKQFKKDLSKAKKSLEQLSQILDEKENNITQMQQSIEVSKQAITEKTNQIDELKQNVEVQKSHINELEEKLRNTREENMKLKLNSESAQKEKDFEITSLKQKISSQVQDIKQKEELIIKLQREKDEKENMLLTKDASVTLMKKQVEKVKKSRDKYAKSVKVLTNTMEEMKKSFRQKKKALREEMRMQEQTLMDRIRKETNEYTTTIMKMNFELEKIQNENQMLAAKNTEMTLEKQKFETKKNAEINELLREKKAYESQIRANLFLANKVTQREQVRITQLYHE